MKKTKKHIENIILTISVIGLVWMFASWADIISNNMTSHTYQWWNMFTILF